MIKMIITKLDYIEQALIEANDFIEFDVPTNKNAGHTFTLASQYNKKISTQKLLKHPLDVQQNLEKISKQSAVLLGR